MPIVQANGINIHYQERGSGDPLILIMGLGAPGDFWEDHVLAYEKHFRCILMDNRGAGQSDKPAGPYTTKMMADDTLGLMDALGIEQAHVSGISMGSTIAQEMTLKSPERIRSITLISSWPKCDAYATRIFEVFKELRPSVPPMDFNRMLQLWIFAPGHYEGHLQDLAEGAQGAVDFPWPMPHDAFAAQCDACIGHDALDRIEAIKAPTLITVGDKDIFTPLHFSQAIAECIAGSELLVLEGCGHAHHWEVLEEFNKRTLEFMRAH
jgi:pimeloyl-ACP methyl ester carboxylesterase